MSVKHGDKSTDRPYRPLEKQVVDNISSWCESLSLQYITFIVTWPCDKNSSRDKPIICPTLTWNSSSVTYPVVLKNFYTFNCTTITKDKIHWKPQSRKHHYIGLVMYNIWKTPEEWNRHSAGFLTKKPTLTACHLARKPLQTLNRWTWHGKTSVSRHWIEI